MSNGPWNITGIHADQGQYRLRALIESPDFVAAYRGLSVPEEGITWRYGGIGFHLVAAEEALGIPGSTVAFLPKISGSLTGLEAGHTATIMLYHLPGIEVPCEETGTPYSGCLAPDPEPLEQTPGLLEAKLIATFSAKGPLWGLLGGGLSTGRFVVVLGGSGYEVNPVGYTFDLVGVHRFAPILDGLDFVFSQTASN